MRMQSIGSIGLVLAGVLSAQNPDQDSRIGRRAPAIHGVLAAAAAKPSDREPIRADAFVGDVLLIVGARHALGERRIEHALGPLRSRLDGKSGVMTMLVASWPADKELDESVGLTFAGQPMVLDRGGRTAKGYGVTADTWFALVDRRGLLRYVTTETDGFALRDKLDELLAEKVHPLIGQNIGPMRELQWPEKGSGPRLDKAELLLMRWWTDECRFCKASLPALDQLVAKHKDRGLCLIAVYHPKGQSPLDAKQMRRYLGDLDVEQAVLAIDPEWQRLRDLMQRGKLDRATSVSFLVDREGTIRWVHPGPRIHDAMDGKFVEAAKDLQGLEAIVEALLPLR